MDAPVRQYRETLRRSAQDELILDHLPFVRQILCGVGRHYPAHSDMENLEAAGVLGLVEAARRYDGSSGIEFKTFAFPRIRGAILDELRRNCPLPQKILKHWSIIRKTMHRLPVTSSVEELARESGLSERDVSSCFEAIRLACPGEFTSELIVSPILDDSENSTSNIQEQTTLLADAIEKLPEKERIVLTLYHLKDLTLRQIGEVVELSESRVSRLLAAGELNLRRLIGHKAGQTEM